MDTSLRIRLWSGVALSVIAVLGAITTFVEDERGWGARVGWLGMVVCGFVQVGATYWEYRQRGAKRSERL
jgi:uncharacterized membrane-anchored protein